MLNSRHYRCCFVLAAMLVLAAVLPAQTAEPEFTLDKKERRAATRLAADLAKAGCKQEYREILGQLERWGEDRESVADARSKADAAFARAKKRRPSKSLSRKPAKLAATLMKKVADLSADEQRFRAEVALFFDSSNKQANELLGRTLEDGVWTTEILQTAERRRASFVEAIRRARALDIKVDVSPSSHEVILAQTGKNGVLVQSHGMAVHTNFEEHRAVRMVKEALRALALSNFVLHGELKVPEIFSSEWVYFDSIVPYEAAAKACIARKGMTDEYARIALTSQGYFRKDRVGVFYSVSENMISGTLFKYAKEYLRDFSGAIPMFKMGHLHWVARSFLGVPLAGMTWFEQVPGENGPREYDRDYGEEEKKKRELLIRMAEAGIAGSRAYVKYLAEKGELPPTTSLLVREMGMLTGISLLKSIHIVEYLQERGDAQKIFEATATAVVSEQQTKLETALGPLTQFDEEWATWLRGHKAGIAQKLGAPQDAWKPSADARSLITYLNKLREPSRLLETEYAWPEVELVRSISTGCELHAAYLGFNPKQVEAWPDAHEEYSDKKGFTPQGCWAGLNSVIAPGVAGGREAIDSWMGTFYHRTPLLEPGLVGVGYGFSKGTAVMDTGSLVNNNQEGRYIVWPHPRMKGVPQRFNPELPNPVKGEDQSAWGYPVTVQVYDDKGRTPRTGKMTLHSGTEKGEVVACHFSTPAEPTNPDLAPAGCFCLIPKSHLSPGQLYTVVAEIEGEKKRVWSFTTAR